MSKRLIFGIYDGGNILDTIFVDKSIINSQPEMDIIKAFCMNKNILAMTEEQFNSVISFLRTRQ